MNYLAILTAAVLGLSSTLVAIDSMLRWFDAIDRLGRRNGGSDA